MEASPPGQPPVRALDTSVLLRYLLADDELQSPTARDLIESNVPVTVTPVTLAEAAWVLTGPRRHVDRDSAAEVLLRFLARENVTCIGVEKNEAQAALLRCRAPAGADFGDALTAACLRSAGVTEIYTFDQQFARAGLTPVTPTTSSVPRSVG